MKYLVDADTLVYVAALMAEGQSEAVAKYNINDAIALLQQDLNSDNLEFYVTGPNNFRYDLYPEYKANRKEDPTYRAICKQHIIDEWGAILSDGCEADDMVGVAQSTSDIPTCIVASDKDLDQIVGEHYKPALWRKGVCLKPAEFYYVSPQDSRYFFYYQLLVGDSVDNIKGAKGIGPKKAAAILSGLETDEEMFDAVLAHYPDRESCELNGKLLWIWREMDGIWKPPYGLVGGS